MVGIAARLELRQRDPDPALLVAAADVQLANGNPKLAFRYAEAAAPHAASSAELQLVLARAQLGVGLQYAHAQRIVHHIATSRPPEQAKGQGVDHRADLYAFGVTLFQIVTGALPFADGDVGYRHVHEPVPDARELRADLPELARLIARMLAKQPAERPADAAEVGEALRRIQAAQL